MGLSLPTVFTCLVAGLQAEKRRQVQDRDVNSALAAMQSYLSRNTVGSLLRDRAWEHLCTDGLFRHEADPAGAPVMR